MGREKLKQFSAHDLEIASILLKKPKGVKGEEKAEGVEGRPEAKGDGEGAEREQTERAKGG